MAHSYFNHSRSLGKIMMVLNLIWLYLVSERLYSQNYGEILFVFMYPNWFLILGTICAITGIILSFFIYREQLSIKYGLSVNMLLFIFYLTGSIFITN